jgi:hypothetical protein
MATRLQHTLLTGGYMKESTQILVRTIIYISTTALFTACGTSKSDVSGSTEQSSRVEVESSKPLASCNRTDTNSFSLNVASVKGSDGKADLNWIKLKFNFLSSEVTQTGYYIRFFKWRVINNSTQLDQFPLEFNSYSLQNGVTNSYAMNGVFTNQINKQNGYYLNLKDDEANPYQVLKVVIYKNDGTIAAQGNILIPQFLANPSDYRLNSNGSPRAQLLQDMHPLKSKNLTGWNSNQIQEAVDQHCF